MTDDRERDGRERGGEAAGDGTRRLYDDFERLSAFVDGGWDHNAWYHGWLLRQVPRGAELALDVGCGGGRFTRELARRAGYVFGVDLSPSTLAVARRLTDEAGVTNVEYLRADVMELQLPPATFDCIVSIACLHHLDLRAAYVKLAAAVKPGGVLLVVDLVRSRLPLEAPYEAAAWPLARVLRLAHTGHLREPQAVREAWDTHGENDAQQLTIGEVRAIAADVLPGASVRRRLLWRYSLVWRRPAHVSAPLALKPAPAAF